ncbi:hypothetical protein Scep_021094 [Stephania cephalantha]|uniref:Lysine-specific demethylase REF6 n=1 Tax=Stephania cephalantha TaxID=152367 RepID=A0AAP0I193_9MAGN
MASSSTSAAAAAAAAEVHVDVPKWLQNLPLAPEYHPTLEEFEDPISYILRIEDEASQYGLCKIVPPLPRAPNKSVITNLNRSIASTIGAATTPTFTTKEQRIGERGMWRSGERCTLHQFEAKAKQFERNLVNSRAKKRLSVLEIETHFWNWIREKPFSPISGECAGEIPGSAFEVEDEKKLRRGVKGLTVGESEWNLRGISRSPGSLLRFMEEEEEEIPGVNSPVLSLYMMFGWFAWHLEDHELPRLNFMHMGEAKTWYGVPGDAAQAFEEVVGVHQFGGDVNPLVTYAALGERTTVMSPKVLMDAGIPCCRLVQNAGEFVLTFPRAYHSGFSHGFNCCEAINIATPKWLMVAREAAIRRAATAQPPVLSHFQLLYAYALSLSSRVPRGIRTKPQKLRVKDMEKEGDTMVKELFVLNILQNNDLLHVLLEQGSSCVLLQQKCSNELECSNFSTSATSGMCIPDEKIETLEASLSNDVMQERNKRIRPLIRFSSARRKSSVASQGNKPSSFPVNNDRDMISEKENASFGYRHFGQELFSCVACGISCSACSAVIQPREEATKYLMSAEFSFFNDWLVGPRTPDDRLPNGRNKYANSSEANSCSDWMEEINTDDLYEVPVQSGFYKVLDQWVKVPSEAEAQRHFSSLDLLADAYGDSSDSDEELAVAEMSAGGNFIMDNLTESSQSADRAVTDCLSYGLEQDHGHEESGKMYHTSVRLGSDGVKSEMDAFSEAKTRCTFDVPVKATDVLVKELSEEYPSRNHIFCLEHAVEVQKQLQSIGGTHLLLLCHPEYPKLVGQAKSFAEELGIDHAWKNISFRDATKEDHEWIQSALRDEESRPSNDDWTVQLGINMSYVVRLSHSLLYSKQMPYNSVIYKAFGCSPPAKSSAKVQTRSKRLGRRNKRVVVGKWCGKVWMSNQLHPYLSQRDTSEEKPFTRVNSQVKVESKAERVLRRGSLNGLKMDPEQTTLPSASKSGTRKAGTKRGTISTKGPNKKPKYLQLDSSTEAVKSPPENTPLPLRRTSRIRKIKCEAVESSDYKVKNSSRHQSKVKEEYADEPKSRLRRMLNPLQENKVIKSTGQNQNKKSNKKKVSVGRKETPADDAVKYKCDIDGCSMEFRLKQELVLHKNDICPVRGCGKKFFNHKYLVQHKRVHVDDRPLKCPWKGCRMTFKWPWARTEHIRVHTGIRPYECHEKGCGQTFRFVSDFSRHKRKTGHLANKKQHRSKV